MIRVDHPEVSLEVPEDWTDQSVAWFAEKIGGLGASIALTHRPARAGAPLAVLVDEAVQKHEQQLPELRVLERTDFELASGVPGAQLFVEWKHPSGLIFELLTLFLHDDALWALTATCPSSRIEHVDSLVQGAVGSLRVSPRSSAGSRNNS